VENRGVVKVDLSSMQAALCTVSVFFILRFTYLGGCIRTQRTPAYGPGMFNNVIISSAGRRLLSKVQPHLEACK